MKIYRQGDVLLIQVEKIPADAKPVERENGRVVLAHGEVTGHSHAISLPNAALLTVGAARFLEVMEAVALEHEEHSSIQLPAANYRVLIQKEYTPKELRSVKD